MRDQVLTKRWNNVLTALLGLPLVAYALVAIATDNTSSLVWFIGLALIGSVY